MKICDKCGAQMPDEALCCTNCGTPLRASQISDEKEPEPQQTFQQPTYQPVNAQPVGSQESNKAVIALVLGLSGIFLIIVAPFLANFPALIGLIVSIVATVYSVKARNELPVNHPNRCMATGGLVCGIVGIVIGAIATVCTVCVCSMAACLAVGAANSDMPNFSEYIDMFTVLFM